MKTSVTFLAISLIAAASALNVGYNYQDSEPRVSETRHQVHVAEHTPQTHDEGYHKEFYHFIAPEEPARINHAQPIQKVTTHTKKNLQVIFIKPPEEKHHVQPVHHNVVNNVVEEKTHIYVLSKEPNHAAVPKKVQTIQQASVHHHKPEIHFLKYHTPSEAHHIQESIIQQYGGKPSEIIHSGSAPIANFATVGSRDHQQGSASVNRQYLAPNP